jgi:transmembrane sensor
LRAHDVTDDDRAAFAAWLARDSRHRREFDELTELWHETAPVARAASIPPIRTVGRHWQLPLALAASALIAAVLFFTKPWVESYRTIHGALATHVLKDGSRLHLNTETTVHVEIDRDARRVTLDRGELFVEVAHDVERPFTVVTRFGGATATGTAFAVRDAVDRAFVTVTEGRVRVAARDGETQTLEPGEQAELGSTDVTTRHVDRASAASWKDGELVYDGVTLAELVEDLNRYLPRRMSITDPVLGARRVSAVLRLGDQEEMLEALSRALPMRWTVVSDTLILLHAA